jgi:hypothetical protein
MDKNYTTAKDISLKWPQVQWYNFLKAAQPGSVAGFVPIFDFNFPDKNLNFLCPSGMTKVLKPGLLLLQLIERQLSGKHRCPRNGTTIFLDPG